MTQQTFEAVEREIPRDRYSRPLVAPPGEDKPVPYTRCTTYVGVLEDTYKLGLWQQRMVATGLSMRPDLQLAVSAHHDDRDKLDKIVADAREAAAASAAATTGTALHALTERIDRGQPLGAIPAAYEADLKAYEQATQKITAHHIERFSVLDSLKIGGTPDRIGEISGDRKLKIIDVKTGSIEYGIGKIAMQLAVYARSMLYDWQTQEREPIGDIDLERAIVIHLPAGSGTCRLVEIDIAAGWRAVEIATQVRDWRKRAKFNALAREINGYSEGGWLDRPAGTVSAAAPVDEKPADVPAQPPTQPSASDALSDAIAAADSIETLGTIWRENRDGWRAEHTELASARKALLMQHAAAT